VVDVRQSRAALMAKLARNTDLASMPGLAGTKSKIIFKYNAQSCMSMFEAPRSKSMVREFHE
jgi:hypothetical protein